MFFIFLIIKKKEKTADNILNLFLKIVLCQKFVKCVFYIKNIFFFFVLKSRKLFSRIAVKQVLKADYFMSVDTGFHFMLVCLCVLYV